MLGAATGFIIAGGLGDGIIGGIGFSGGTPAASFAAGAANGFIRGFAVGTVGSLVAGTSFSVALRNGLIGGAFASASTVAKLVYEKYVGYPADPAPGGEVVDKPVGVAAVDKANNISLANCSWWACEGQLLSKALNQMWGMNAFGGLHDTLTQGMSRLVFPIANIPSMIPAMGFTYFALTNGAPLNVLRETFDPGHDRN